MSDMGVVILRFPGEYVADLAVYSHWTGSMLTAQVREIAESGAFRGRIGDAAYAARIMISQLMKDSPRPDVGFGVYPIARGEGDGDAPVEVEVDLETGAVTITRDEEETA